LDAFKAVRGSVPDLTLLLVPRHPERLGEVEALLEREGLPWLRRSRMPSPTQGGAAVILVDTMGELARLYAAGTVVFVGGSLVPIGGHNILEPAIHARPVLFGPHMGNFADMGRLFLEQRAGVEVRDARTLAEETLRLLREPRVAEGMGETGRTIVETHRGAGRRTMDLLEAVL
jgi:3-deoxy-D-manno-octulosonic-acid transferase